MNVSLVAKFQNKLIYIHQLMFYRKEGVKESRNLKSYLSHASERMPVQRHQFCSSVII
jgi:hypothetical protein